MHPGRTRPTSGVYGETGKLIVAGRLPVTPTSEASSSFERNRRTRCARSLGRTRVSKAGRLVLELHRWFAPAGLQVNDPKPPARQ